jgi:hypothetical protein
MEFRLLTFRLFRAFRNPPFIDLPVGKSSAIPAGIDIPVRISSALPAGIDLPVGTPSALAASIDLAVGINLAVGSPSALTAGTDQPSDLLRPYRSATTFRSEPVVGSCGQQQSSALATRTVIGPCGRD